MSYKAPIKDLLFCMTELAGLERTATLPGFEDAGIDTAQAVLDECARFNEGVIAPLNADGDRNPSAWKDGAVTTTPGFKDAYRQYAEGGWQGLQHPALFGRELARRGRRVVVERGLPEVASRRWPWSHTQLRSMTWNDMRKVVARRGRRVLGCANVLVRRPSFAGPPNASFISLRRAPGVLGVQPGIVFEGGAPPTLPDRAGGVPAQRNEGGIRATSATGLPKEQL